MFVYGLYVSENTFIPFLYLKDIILVRVLFSLNLWKAICCYWELSGQSSPYPAVGHPPAFSAWGGLSVFSDLQFYYDVSGRGFLFLYPALIIDIFQQFGKFCSVISENTQIPLSAFTLLSFSGAFSH